jgi:hypothetical protein
MAPGDTYQQAVTNWATYMCHSGAARAHPGFCEWSYTVGNEPADAWDALWVAARSSTPGCPHWPRRQSRWRNGCKGGTGPGVGSEALWGS